MAIVADNSDTDNYCQRLDRLSPACYSGSVTDPTLEKLIDRAFTVKRSRLVDCHLIWLDAEGFTSGKGVGQ
ncbi:MAG: hypothetical protein LVS60_05410 [Nodosilinea sp. LVE1205-7]|jgi:hypothetical protein